VVILATAVPFSPLYLANGLSTFPLETLLEKSMT